MNRGAVVFTVFLFFAALICFLIAAIFWTP
jgi:hypothetical protein